MTNSEQAPMPTEHKVSDDLQLPKGCSGNGNRTGYLVQARYNHPTEAKQFGDTILDMRWKTLHFAKALIGVPTRREWDWHLAASDCMTFEAAQALRWWFLANCESEGFCGSLCVETRIVVFKIQYSHTSVAEGVLEEDKDAWRKRSM
jgi:hypothetical protein